MYHIMDRLAYATIRQNFDWRNVIFSDEAVVSNGKTSQVGSLECCMLGVDVI